MIECLNPSMTEVGLRKDGGGLLRQTPETTGGFKELVNASFLSLDQTRNSLLISTVWLSCGPKRQTGLEEEVTTDSIYK